MSDDFIGVYQDTLTPQQCQNFISLFETMKNMKMTMRRNPELEGTAHEKSDETFFLSDYIMGSPHNPQFTGLMDKFWTNYKDYTSKYSSLQNIRQHNVQQIRIQKTLPGEGYHLWHFENGYIDVAKRIVAWMVYLNDVEEGGETEFLYLHKRVRPKAGTMLIWPAGFTHTHRGNQPLSGSKYIITSWTEHE